MGHDARAPAMPITSHMSVLNSALSCCGSVLAALSRAAAKSAAAQLRRLGLLQRALDWRQRAEICELCPLRVVHKGTSYCGRPFLHQIDRDPAEDGCGCPTIEKARSPREHCPRDWHNRPSRQLPDGCTCKWCNPYAGTWRID